MNRWDIQQRVYNTIGTIIVDKSEIREEATLEELALDNTDIDVLFDLLQMEFGIVFAPRIRNRADKAPEHLTLQILIDVILVMTANDHDGQDPPFD